VYVRHRTLNLIFNDAGAFISNVRVTLSCEICEVVSTSSAMTAPTIAPYGSWKSPITSDLIVAGSIRLGDIAIEGETIYWSEGRPAEAGRNAIVCYGEGTPTTITPMPFNARTRVHEYGGGSYFVTDGVLYFSNFADQRLYRLVPGADAEPLTPETGYRYADGVSDRQRQRLIYVREDHTAGGHEPVNAIVAVDLTAEQPDGGQVLVSGSDFYANPRLSPDGSQLCWLSWNHPNMPWDGTELWVAKIQADGMLHSAQRIAGGVTEAVFQPEWSPDGSLYFVSDRTGWWNLYRWSTGEVQPLCPKAAEFGLPLWVFGMTTYGIESADSLICTYVEAGIQHLARLNLRSLELTEIEIPYTHVDGLKVGDGFAVMIGGSATAPSAIVRLDLASGTVEELRRSSELSIDPGYLSTPEVIEFPTESGLTAFGFFYAPQNRDYTAPADQRPPLLVKSHGGPTAATSASFSPSIQYWTSRGIAILDVNYGGSTGYGRAYRERLKGRWGIVDVDDCANGAKYLVTRGLVDGDRLCIDGGSAGGYTTLAALTFRNVFKAGASFYGVSDLEALARDTHKFEARYLDGLIGKYPEERQIYVERSPIHAVDRLSCPVIFFQGDEDKIVPPNQAEMMVDALKAKGLPVAYVLYEGEQHGFRKAENIKRTLDGELYFYSRVFGFELADAIEPVAIENL
jgi:dipeptidyl aminopeptidase/acylaminoacyl peptidase